MNDRPGEAIVFTTMSILLSVIGYKVIGWWAPGLIIASFVVGTYANFKYTQYHAHLNRTASDDLERSRWTGPSN